MSAVEHGGWKDFPEGVHRVSFYGCCYPIEPRKQCNARAVVMCGTHSFEAGWCGVARCIAHKDADAPRGTTPPSGERK